MRASISKKLYFFSLGASILLLLPIISSGQSQTQIGPSASLHLNRHTFGIHVLGDLTAPLFPNHVDIGGSLGIRLQRHLDSRWSFSGELAINSFPGESKVRVVNPEGEFYQIEFLDLPFDSTSDRIFLHAIDVGYYSVSVGLFTQWRPIIDSSWNIGLELGPTFHTIIKHSMKQTLQIESPANVHISSPDDRPREVNGRRLVLLNGNDIDSRPIRLGIKAGLFAEFGNRDSGMVFAPRLFYEYGATTLQKTSDWRVHRFGAEFIVLFRL